MKPAGDKHRERRGNQAPIDSETVFAGEQRHGRFVVAHFHGQRCAIGVGDVRRIGDHDIKAFSRPTRCEQIAVQKANAVRDTVAFGILPRNGQRRPGKIDRGDACGSGQLVRQGDRNGS